MIDKLEMIKELDNLTSYWDESFVLVMISAESLQLEAPSSTSETLSYYLINPLCPEHHFFWIGKAYVN